MPGYLIITERGVTATVTLDGLPLTILENGVTLVPNEEISINVSSIALPAAIAIHNADPESHPYLLAKIAAAMPLPYDDNSALLRDINGDFEYIATGAVGREALTWEDATAAKTTLGLENVDNTADADKPVSGPQQDALDLKSSVILDSSRLVSGGDVTETTSTTVTVAAGVGFTFDSATGVLTPVSWDLTVLDLSTPIGLGYDASYILVDAYGTVSYINTEPLDGALRDYIYLSKVAHRSGGAITNIRMWKFYGEEVMQAFRELTYAMGPLNMSGNTYSCLSGMAWTRSLGTAFRHNINADLNRKDPNFVTDASTNSTANPFVYCQAKTGGGVLYTAGHTVVDAAHYDTGNSTLGTVGVNKWSVQRIYYFPRTKSTYFWYGRVEYNKKDDAIAGITTEDFDLDTTFFDGAILRAYLVVRGGATDLSDIDEAKCIHLGKFGSGAASGGGGAVEDAIVYGVTDVAPSQNAVYVALEEKEDSLGAPLTETSMLVSTPEGVRSWEGLDSFKLGSVTATVGNGVDVIQPGWYSFSPPIGANSVITGWSLLEVSNPPLAGSIVFDLFKSTVGTFPTVGSSIITTGKPTLSSAYAASGTVTGSGDWSNSLSVNDVLKIYIDSCSTCKTVTLRLITSKV